MDQISANVQKILLSYLLREDIDTIINSNVIKLFDVLLSNEHWRHESKKYSMENIPDIPLGINYYNNVFPYLCMNCGRVRNNGDNLKYFNYVLCFKCQRKKEFKRINEASASINFGVKDNDLLSIKSQIYKCYAFPYGNIMTVNINFYLKSDIEEIKNEQVLKEKKERSIDYPLPFGRHLKESEIRTEDIRKDKLIEELSKYKLPLRDDSMLCITYIRGINKKTLSEIIQKMCLMKFLFDYTDYANRMRILIAQSKWRFVAYDNSERRAIAQNAILKTIGGSWPDLWPWMNN